MIHPFSGSARKSWPLDNFRELERQLEAEMPVHWCAGPEDPPLEGAVRIGDFYELARWLARARLYVGNDSGITHLAAAVGTPVRALFGPTDPEVWAPRGPHVQVGRISCAGSCDRLHSKGGRSGVASLVKLEMETAMDGLIIRFHDTLPETEDGANQLHTQFGFAIVTETYLNAHKADQMLAQLKKSGELYLHGHGEPKALGGKSPTEMAKFLADQGLTGPVIINLYACNGGTGGAPYALELKVALVQGHKIMCSVSGAKGFLDLANGNWSIAKNLSDAVGSGPALNAPGSKYQTSKVF